MSDLYFNKIRNKILKFDWRCLLKFADSSNHVGRFLVLTRITEILTLIDFNFLLLIFAKSFSIRGLWSITNTYYLKTKILNFSKNLLNLICHLIATHSSKIEKLKFRKDYWSTLTEILYQKRSLVRLGWPQFHIIVCDKLKPQSLS